VKAEKRPRRLPDKHQPDKALVCLSEKTAKIYEENLQDKICRTMR
jgi:hypothetical protein